MGGGGGGEEEQGDRQTEPLLEKLPDSSYNSSQEHLVKRTGTVWTATAHIITAVIGSGVLSLAWSVAQLGWVGGPAAMVLFAGVTLVQSSLLADCYISHDPDERGAVVRNKSYVDAVKLYLGVKSEMFCGFFLSLSLFGNGVVYTLASATSMSVSWEFLLQLLSHRGFPRSWCNLISVLLMTSSTRILVNGQLSPKLLHRRGLRQGDPLSPLLFVLVMDCLARLMNLAQESDILKPLGRQPVKFRTSIYADDVMIFLKPAKEELEAAAQIIRLFGEATGLHPNFAKSNLIPIRCEEVDLAPMIQSLACPLGAFPCRYLGMPLSDSRLSRIDYQSIIDKLISKFSGWKIGWISSVGRAVLVKAVLSAIPIFQMIAIAQPKWFDKIIDKIRRSFLWTGKSSAPGAKCLVRWDAVCRPMNYGGLGISNLHFQSHALKMRWLWQQATQPDKPWQGLPFLSDKVATSIFKACTEIIIGDGKSTLFWQSHWINGTPLREQFPALYKHITGAKSNVADALAENTWIRCIKPRPSIEVLSQYLHMANMLAHVQLTDQPDRVRWKLTADGCYSAKSAYHAQFLGMKLSSFPKLIWKTKVPPKCQFFAWLAIQGRCLTADRLKVRKIQHNPICSLCHIHKETALHLLAQCHFARQIWGFIFSNFGITARLPTADESSLENWWREITEAVPRATATKINCIIICTWWRLWKKRNNRCFNKKAINLNQLGTEIITELKSWKQARLRGADWMPPD